MPNKMFIDECRNDTASKMLVYCTIRISTYTRLVPSDYL